MNARAPKKPHEYQAAPIRMNRIIPPIPIASATPTTQSQNFQPNPSSFMPLPSHRRILGLQGRPSALSRHRPDRVKGVRRRLGPLAAPGEGRAQSEQQRRNRRQEAVDEHRSDDAGVVPAEADERSGQRELDD